MTIELFLAIALLIFAAVGAIVYWFANKHMFIRNRRKRYVRAPRYGIISRLLEVLK